MPWNHVRVCNGYIGLVTKSDINHHVDCLRAQYVILMNVALLFLPKVLKIKLLGKFY